MIDLFAREPGEPDAFGADAIRVRETGLAVVHEGEWVLPGEGSAAALEAMAPMRAAGPVIEVPIEIDVRPALDDAQARRIARIALADLRDALDAEAEVG